jgi:hypothetical protein
MLRHVALVTRHNIPEDINLHSHRRENLKSYIDEYSPQFLHNYGACILLEKFKKFDNINTEQIGPTMPHPFNFT